MKRGFLKTSRGKRAIERIGSPDPKPSPQAKSPTHRKRAAAAEDALDEDGDVTMAEAEPPNKDRKGKGKQKAADTDENTTNGLDEMLNGYPPRSASANQPPPGFIFDRPPPARPGWGRPQHEEFYHMVPESHGGPLRKRFVFRQWPRDPNGKPLLVNLNHNKGTLSPDGYPWGATLYDLFAVHKVPQIPGMISYMTGSALSEGVQELGEVEVAAPEIEWAKSEGQPRVAGVADTEELIFCQERRVKMVAAGWSVDNMNRSDSEGEASESEEEDHFGHGYDDRKPVIPTPPRILPTSPFHSTHYPKPWPTIPFKNSQPILLQERIPMYLLPQKLYVHDPFYLLPARKRRFDETSWGLRPDIIQSYNLDLSQLILQEVQEARRKAEALEEFKSRTLVALRFKRTKKQIKNCEPVIEVPLPPYPRRPTKIEESHLYLSPAAKVGVGNHSVVYKAEWEVPRDLFVRPKICPQCFQECAEKEIKRLKDTGRYEELMKAAAWDSKGSTGRDPTKAELEKASDPVILTRDGEIIEREVICIVPPNAAPSQVLDALDASDLWDVFMQQRTKTTAILDMAGSTDGEDNSDVAHLRIDSPFSYEGQKTCKHDERFAPTPRTTMFTVVAKLSIEHDPHLAREAQNYQQFPEHLFHHYNGYTILQQLHTVVPVHAVIPQFYGYYTPNATKKNQPYLSPILLLEHCGKPIKPEKLSVEDQEECASLVLRFQRTGWLQESIAERNFLVQYGKPTEFPLTRTVKPEPSFRLIDFGRSRTWTTAEEKRKEEGNVLRMFQALRGSMASTISVSPRK